MFNKIALSALAITLASSTALYASVCEDAEAGRENTRLGVGTECEETAEFNEDNATKMLSKYWYDAWDENCAYSKFVSITNLNKSKSKAPLEIDYFSKLMKIFDGSLVREEEIERYYWDLKKKFAPHTAKKKKIEWDFIKRVGQVEDSILRVKLFEKPNKDKDFKLFLGAKNEDGDVDFIASYTNTSGNKRVYRFSRKNVAPHFSIVLQNGHIPGKQNYMSKDSAEVYSLPEFKICVNNKKFRHISVAQTNKILGNAEIIRDNGHNTPPLLEGNDCNVQFIKFRISGESYCYRNSLAEFLNEIKKDSEIASPTPAGINNNAFNN